MTYVNHRDTETRRHTEIGMPIKQLCAFFVPSVDSVVGVRDQAMRLIRIKL